MKRLVILDVEVADVDELRRVARGVGYAAWAALDCDRKPVVNLAVSDEADTAMRAAWEALP